MSTSLCSTAAARYAQLPGRDLTRPELVDLTAAIASTPSEWGEHVAFDDEQRHYHCLHRDSHVDVWVLCWTPRNDTGWHDHDTSSGSVAVVQGRLVEQVLTVGAAAVAREATAGDVYSFGPDHIHRLTGVDEGTVSIHAYSPPLCRMGQYTVGTDGTLHRTSLSYAEELRSVRDAAIPA
ncbi:MAG: cysteine dioxygenase [Jatrophihabitans sp.]